VEALALAYVEGKSPTGENRPVMAKLLGGWLNRSQTIHIGEVPAWQALEKAHGRTPCSAASRKNWGLRVSSNAVPWRFRPLEHPSFAHGWRLDRAGWGTGTGSVSRPGIGSNT